MYVGYMFHNTGSYHSPIYLKTINDCLSLIFRFKGIVPKMMITHNDEAVIEAECGIIIHPVLQQDKLDELKLKYPACSSDISLEDALAQYNAEITSLYNSQGAEDEKHHLRSLEHTLLAIAAKTDINLYEYGYNPSENVITQFEELEA